MRTDRAGNPLKNPIPRFDELLIFYDRQFKHKTMSESKISLAFNGKFYEEHSDAILENFAQQYFRPFANTYKVNEFRNLAFTFRRDSNMRKISDLIKKSFINFAIIAQEEFHLGKQNQDLGNKIVNFTKAVIYSSPLDGLFAECAGQNYLYN